MNIEIANRLQQLRKKKGMSQEELASALGISRQAVSKWERAEAAPDTDNLITLAKLYGVSLDELLTSEDGADMPETDEVVNDEKKKGHDSVHVYPGGVHVVSEDGDEVDVGFSGIHINNKEDYEVKDDGVYVNGKKIDKDDWRYHRYDKKFRTVRDILSSITFLLVTIAYIVIGTMFNLWHPGWLLFFIVPLVTSLCEAIKCRDMKKFAYPVLVAGIYLLFGFLQSSSRFAFHINGGWWHPYWFLFLTIPLYAVIGDFFNKMKCIARRKKNKNVVNGVEVEETYQEDDDEDDEDDDEDDYEDCDGNCEKCKHKSCDQNMNE